MEKEKFDYSDVYISPEALKKLGNWDYSFKCAKCKINNGVFGGLLSGKHALFCRDCFYMYINSTSDLSESIKLKPHARVPQIVRILSYNYDSWIVGSSIDYILGNSEEVPKDIDVIVPPRNWSKASRLIPSGTPSNSFGGFKVTEGNFQIDIWSDDVYNLFLTSFSSPENMRALHLPSKRILRFD